MSACPRCGYFMRQADHFCPGCGQGNTTIRQRKRPDSAEWKQGFCAGCVSQFGVWFLAAFSPFGLYLSQLGEQPAAFHALTFACALAVGGFCALAMRHHNPAFARGVGRSLYLTFTCFLLLLALWH